MAITPRFRISQSESHVEVSINVPHVRVSPDEVHVVLTDENKCLHFASTPYLLVLTFEHAFEDNADENCATYDPLDQDGTITLRLKKKDFGVQWQNLDLLGALMQPRGKKEPSKSNVVLEVESDGNIISTTNDEESNDTNRVMDLIDSQEQDNQPFVGLTSGILDTSGYGFLNLFRGVFTDLARDGLAREMLEVPLESFTSEAPDQLHQMRLETEQSKFSADRYLQDLEVEDDYLYQAAMDMHPHWETLQGQDMDSITENLSALQVSSLATTSTTTSPQDYFTKEEALQLATIPYPILPTTHTSSQQKSLLVLVDLLFAYVYDHLLTTGDPTVESAWTITILSASLSWLTNFDRDNDDLPAVVQSSIRRALVYPYLRSLDFAIHVWRQVVLLLQAGRRCIIRSLLQVRNILHNSEMYYLGTKLYIDPCLAYLQKQPISIETRLNVLSKELRETLDHARLKETLGLPLQQIENEFLNPDEETDHDETEDEETDDSTSSEDDSSSQSTSVGSDCQENDTSLEASKAEHTTEGATSEKAPKATIATDLLDANIGTSASPLLVQTATEPADPISSQRTPLIQEMD